MDKKKIMIIDVGREYGGAERMIESLISTLDNKFEISLIVNNKGRFKERMDNKYNINLLSIKNSLNKLPVNIIKVNKYVKDNKIEIINAHGIISGLIGLVIKKISKVKLIVTVHSDLKYDFQSKKRVIYELIENTVIKNADRVVTVSENLQKKLQQRTNVSNIITIYNGISIENNIKFNKKNNEIFEVCCVGRLEKVKNINFLIDGIALLKSKGNFIKCNIIGDGSQKSDLEFQITQLGLKDTITLLGYKENVNEYIANSNLLIMTSIMEGIPMTIIEAFANKTAVLASDVGGISEMIQDNFNGILFESGNLEMFCDKLQLIINKEINISNIERNAYRDYCNKWSLERMSACYYEAFKSL